MTSVLGTFVTIALITSSSWGQTPSAPPQAPLVQPATPAPVRTRQWIVTRTEWTADDDIRFGQFVQALAKTKCSNVQECMKSPANPYRDTDPVDARFWSDCADWPFFLRAYYSWKNGLPFSYINSVGTWDRLSDEDYDPYDESNYEIRRERVCRDNWFFGRQCEWEEVRVPKPRFVDPRYTKSGNYPRSRARIAPAPNKLGAADFFRAIDTMQNAISTASLRFGPDVETPVLPDLYPIDITVDSVRPGTVAYGPNGHVSIVYEVTRDGRILLFNAHPASKKQPHLGTPVSRTTFETRKEYVRSNPAHGSGLKNWRPFRLEGATLKDGRYIGGRLVHARNADISDFSRVQFYGTQGGSSHERAVFEISGQKLPYENFVRYRLARAKIDPLVDFEASLNEVCVMMHDRVRAVQAAVEAGLHRQAHPRTIPQNIFTASGEWEDFSSPSRDLRLRAAFYNIRVELQNQVRGLRANDPMIIRRPDLKNQLIAAYERVAKSCNVTYVNSASQPVLLTFEDVMARLVHLSFDPYHCPERRWGATSQAELATCRDDATKVSWYRQTAFIRNHLDRNWAAPRDIALEDLSRANFGFGRPSAPNLDVKSLLQSLPANL